MRESAGKDDDSICKEHGKTKETGPCPFAQEIHDCEDECYCCPECRHDCAMEI